MRALIAALGLCAAVGSAGPARAADALAGKKPYDYWCATCHGAALGEGRRPLPGTSSLQVKYGGAKPAVLEQRDDLTADYVKLVIRKGSKGMPFFRKTEVSDAAMDDIAAYLSRNTK